MPNIREVVLNFAYGGMNESVHAGLLDQNAVSRMVNCQIKDQLPTTRPGVKVLQLGEDGNGFRKANIQGACFYNPVLGQSQLALGPDKAGVVVAAGGHKYHFSFGPTGIVSVSDETGSETGIETVHLAWLFQAENYVICQDGASQTWIWDGESQAFFSNGYRNDEPLKSELANAATAGGYAHGRIIQVVDGKKIIVGDLIHKNNLTSARNILQTTEQVYYATGAFFSPPSNMGDVTAIAILPLKNTQHGHDDVIVHCKYGVFSIKLDHYPRTDWPTQAIAKHLLLHSAAVGPYAVALYDGDQFFRSRFGIQSIRSAAASDDILGNPLTPISQPVKSWLDADHPGLLKFSSLARWTYANRLLCTTDLWVDGSHRGGRGLVSLNMNPVATLQQGQLSWEGLWTLPKPVDRIVQLVTGIFGDQEKMIALCTTKKDNEFKNSIAEFTPNRHEDVLEDGTVSPISCQLITRLAPKEDHITDKIVHDGRLIFRNVNGSLDWGVWLRNSESAPWVLWNKGNHCVKDACEYMQDCLIAQAKSDVVLNLGDAPNGPNKGRHFQALIRWRGDAQCEALRFGLEMVDSEDRASIPQDCVAQLVPCDYTDTEYSNPLDRWEKL